MYVSGHHLPGNGGICLDNGRGKKMETKLKMIYWKGKKFWVGKLSHHEDAEAPNIKH